MKYIWIICFTACLTLLRAQNNLSLSSIDGKAFRVIAEGKIFNETPQAHVLMEKLRKDTLQLEIEFENRKKFPATVYLLEKGVACNNKEFNYKVEFDGINLKLRFATVYDVLPAPGLLVPARPVADTSKKQKNTMMGRFCELKEGKPVYFNNLPKEGRCIVAMPSEYMGYVELLMAKAGTPDQKFTITENVCRNNCITVEQLAALLGYVDYEVDKLKLVRIAYPVLTDPANKGQLNASFRFEASKKELADLFKTADTSPATPGNNICRQAASQMAVETYAERLRVCNNDTERYEVLKKGYASLCYSAAQVTLVLDKFIHDREKLEAAKLLYYYCVEKDSFMNISSVFSYGQTRNELKDFIDKQQN